MLAQRNPRDMHGAKRSGKENFLNTLRGWEKMIKLPKTVSNPVRSKASTSSS
jgi:hypothetical protein